MKLLLLLLLALLSSAARGSDAPGYGDVKPTVDAIIKAIDAKDVDAIFEALLDPADLSKLKSDADHYKDTKDTFMRDKSADLKAVLGTLASAPCAYDAANNTLTFTIAADGKADRHVHFRKVGEKWYIQDSDQ